MLADHPLGKGRRGVLGGGGVGSPGGWLRTGPDAVSPPPTPPAPLQSEARGSGG